MVIVVSNMFGSGRHFRLPKSQAWWYLGVCGMMWAACQRVQSVYTCLYLSELRRRTLSCVKESSVVASPLSCSPSPADSWCDVHEVPPWHLPTNKLRFFWESRDWSFDNRPFWVLCWKHKNFNESVSNPTVDVEYFGICCWWSWKLVRCIPASYFVHWFFSPGQQVAVYAGHTGDAMSLRWTQHLEHFVAYFAAYSREVFF